jgi:SAM-dependent methyltransferase
MNYRDLNRLYWDARTSVHSRSRFYDVPGFLAGASSLPRIDDEIVGSVRGKRLLHLQCHFGLDTLSWARKGAIVTGVDFSPAAIGTARELAKQSGLQAEFMLSDVYRTADVVQGEFDIVYTSWGAFVWLPDLKPWAQMAAKLVATDGVVHINEFHPVLYTLGEDGEFAYDYFNNEVGYDEVTKGTYTDGDEELPAMRSVTWNHSIAEMVQPMLNVGFRLELLVEHDFSPFGCFAQMREDKPGEWVSAKYGRRIPYALSLKFARARARSTKPTANEQP